MVPAPGRADDARRHIAADCAGDIATLLASDATWDGEPIAARHVAVLVGEWSHAELVRAALAQRGIPAVVGGGVAVADALERAVAEAGAEVLTSRGVSGIAAGDEGAEVTWHDGSASHTVAAGRVLANVAPWVLSILLGGDEDPATKPHWESGPQDVSAEDVERVRFLRKRLALAQSAHFHVDDVQLLGLGGGEA